MKKLLIAFFALSVFACSDPKSTAIEGELVGQYGEEIDTEGMISTEKMIAMIDQSEEVHVKVKGEITATCAMKGCWMNLVLPDGEEMRVTFKDYGFFVPSKGMEGNVAVIEGQVKRTTTDVATLRHYAEDAGKPRAEIEAITEEKDELTFEATGVLIYDVEESEE
jgi:hypothetical protein